jgi:hypothetical protein
MVYGCAIQGEVAMRIESSISAISWIPEAAIEGLPKLPFELGIGHYDPAPPEQISPGDLERLRDEDRFREANHLAAWIDVVDGRITVMKARRSWGQPPSKQVVRT